MLIRDVENATPVRCMRGCIAAVGTVVAWESDCWLVNDLGHSVGAFLTSSGAAGVAAVLAAFVAAKQVYRNRVEDKRANRKQEDDRHSERLWTRFAWIAANRADLGPVATAQMLTALDNSAKDHPDQSLQQLLSVHRRHVVRRTDEIAARQQRNPRAD